MMLFTWCVDIPVDVDAVCLIRPSAVVVIAVIYLFVVVLPTVDLHMCTC